MKKILILAAAVLWAFMGVFLYLLGDRGLTAMQVAAVRCSLAAVIYGVFLLITDRKAFRFELRDIWMFLGSGVASLMLFNLCYFRAIQLSGMGVAAVLLYTAPAFVMVMSRFLFKESITLKKIAALVMTVAGCVLVCGVLGGGRIMPRAALLGVASGFFYALYSIFGKYALRKYGAKTLAFYTFLFAGAGLVPLSGVLGNLSGVTDAKGILSCLGMAVVACILPYVFYSEGLRYTEAGQASVMASLEPVTAAVLGAVFFKESMPAFKLLGMALVIGAIALINIGPKKARK